MSRVTALERPPQEMFAVIKSPVLLTNTDDRGTSSQFTGLDFGPAVVELELVQHPWSLASRAEGVSSHSVQAVAGHVWYVIKDSGLGRPAQWWFCNSSIDIYDRESFERRQKP